MTKHLGNMLEPIALMDRHGADAVRWFMAAGGSPVVGPPGRATARSRRSSARCCSPTGTPSPSRRCTPDRRLGAVARPTRPRPSGRSLDRWVLSELHATGRARSTAGAGGVRHPARRPAAGRVHRRPVELVRPPLAGAGSGTATRRRSRTLHECVETVTLLLAPLTPFITERVWQDLVVPVTPDAPDSVHLASWPAATRRAIDAELARRWRWSGGWSSWAGPPAPSPGVKTRQPLSPRAGRGAGLDGAVRRTAGAGRGGAQRRVARRRSPRRRRPGRHHGEGELPRPGQAVRQARPGRRRGDRRRRRAALSPRPARAGTAAVVVDGEPVELGPEEVIVTETPREGWAVADRRGRDRGPRPGDHAGAAAGRAGPRRVRLIQEARKSTGLDVTDRIELRWTGDRPEPRAALAEHARPGRRRGAGHGLRRGRARRTPTRKRSPTSRWAWPSSSARCEPAGAGRLRFCASRATSSRAGCGTTRQPRRCAPPIGSQREELRDKPRPRPPEARKASGGPTARETAAYPSLRSPAAGPDATATAPFGRWLPAPGGGWSRGSPVLGDNTLEGRAPGGGSGGPP